MRTVIPRMAALALAAFAMAAAFAAETETPDDRLALGDVLLTEYGKTSLPRKTTVYPVSTAGFSAAEAKPGVEWSLSAWTVGRTISEQPSDFRIGESCSTLPEGEIDWDATKKMNKDLIGRAIIFDDNTTNDARRIIFTQTGSVKINWYMKEAPTTPVTVTYKIDRSVNTRPYRLYATRADESSTSAYIDLSGKYVNFFGDAKLVRTNTVDAAGYGIEYDGRSGLLTYRYKVSDGKSNCPQGQFVLAYYDTATKDHMVARIVVEVTPPRVNTLSAQVGEELRPLGGGFGIAGLSPAVNSGTKVDPDDPYSPYVETYEMPQSTATGDEKGQMKLYAIAPTDVSTSKLGMDMPWKIDVYWRSPDPMGTLWTFEDDWYLVTWPEGAPKVVTSGDIANPGYPLVLPSVYSASVLNYRRPLHLNVSYDSSTHCVMADDTGRFILRLAVGENGRPYYMPVECVNRKDSRVCVGEPVEWAVGREITLCRGEDAGALASLAAKMDPSRPGYIHVPVSEGRNWNPKLYHFSAGSGIGDMLGSVLENNAFASLESSIYGVNESSTPIEVWWSGVYRGDGTKGNALPAPVVYPGIVQKYAVGWRLAELEGVYPTILLYSQKGSADERMTAVMSLGLLLSETNSSAKVRSEDFGVSFKAYERLHLGFSISSIQLDVKTHVVRPGRIATVSSVINPRVALEIEVAEVDAKGYSVVTRGAGFETVTNRYKHLDWKTYEVEIPPKLADCPLEIAFGDTGVGGAPAAVNIVLDDLVCWHGDADGPRDLKNTEFFFTFGEEDDDGEGFGSRGRSVGAVLGVASLVCRNSSFTFGAPSAYDGVFSAENGIVPEVFYQNDNDQIGYNPNEEHAFIERSGADYVAWALRNDLNGRSGTTPAMVFVQYAEDGKGRMATFRVSDEDAAEATGEVLVGRAIPVPKPLGILTGGGTSSDRAYTMIWKNDDSNPIYKDRKHQLWARRDGSADVRYRYPNMRSLGFACPTRDGDEPADGELIAWMNNENRKKELPTGQELRTEESRSWKWQCVWPATNGVPTMRIGQALTTAKDGLPEMWNAASMSVLYPCTKNPAQRVVDLIDPTVAQTGALPITSGDFLKEYGFTVGPTGNCTLRKGKYYFNGCPPSVSDRFYVDMNAAEKDRMVLVGDRVEKESGGSYLRLNVLTPDEREALRGLCTMYGTAAKDSWNAAVDKLAQETRKASVTGEAMSNGLWTVVKDVTFVVPGETIYTNAFATNVVSGYVVCSDDSTNVVTGAKIGQNVAVWRLLTTTNITVNAKKDRETYDRCRDEYERDTASTLCFTNGATGVRSPLPWPWPDTSSDRTLVKYSGTFTWQTDDKSLATEYSAKDHLALIATGDGVGWVTLIENDDPDTAHVVEGLPVQMHVLRVEPKLHTDGIAVIADPMNKLSEQLSLLYGTPFGEAATNFVFEWKRKTPNADGTLEKDKSRWLPYPGDQRGRVSLLLGKSGASPDEYVNTYYTVRYRPVEGTPAYAKLAEALKQAGVVSPTEDMMWSDWAPEQLAEGWLQRVLNSVTPFAQRVEDFYANPSDIGYTMLEQIGKPWTGNVALNNDNLTQIGLMELYQTLFNRVETMLVSYPNNNDLSKQMMLAATRLNEFYALLGAEAYSDAKNPLIGSADGTQFPAGTFSFANQVATLLDEELALLRGRAASTQFPRMTEAPCFNRLAWNFTKGITEGEPAYVNNYGIRARDGIMDVNCAAAQYPQGHGDAWGHYLSAVKIYYRLLRNPAFDWMTSMSEMLMDQKIMNVDYQDEQKFADAAAKLAQTGLDAFELTLRKSYREKSGSREQGGGSREQGGGSSGEGSGWYAGMFDSNTNQAFGCGEWATRIEMGAVYNWMLGNALLPSNNAPYQAFTDRGITKIDRTTALSLGSLCTTVETLDRKLADHMAGMNPLGLAEGAIPFDIDPVRLAEKNSHFEQILERAEGALANCRTVLDYANVYGSRLRQLQEEETDALAEREKTELAYNNQLIAIYGTPFPGDIGAGGTYPQGYDGPDIYNYNCMDLEPYGLLEAPADNKTLVTNFVRSVYSYNTNEVRAITYEVTPGGIRVKNKNMTGVRATEGTLQAKYREYLTAYQAYQGAIAGYSSAVDAMLTAASDIKVAMGTSQLSSLGTIVKTIAGIGTASYDSQTAANRWNGIHQDLNKVAEALYKQAGVTIAGPGATGGDVAKQVVLAKLEMQHFAKEKDSWNGGIITITNLTNAVHVSTNTNADTIALLNKYIENISNVDVTTLFDKIAASTLAGATDASENAMYTEAIVGVVQALFDEIVSMITSARTNRREMQAAIDGVSTAISGIETAVVNLKTAEAAYRAEQYKGDLLQDERALWRQQMSNRATASRYADMFNRVQRNIALTKYSTAFDTAQRYVWELAKVYDYETGLLSSDEKSGKLFLADIIATRTLGVEGVPIASGTTDGGLYDVVARMKANWNVLEGRLGINNPDKPTKWFSLRYDNFRIGYSNGTDRAWGTVLKNRIVDDIGADADFRRYCQPLALSTSAVQGPGIVLTFETSIWGDRNFFGNPLVPGNEQFSAADYATKIDAVGVYFQGYDEYAVAGGSFVREPNVYLVPIGIDCMRSPAGTDDRKVLGWSVVDQVLPLPYAIGSTELDDPSWISTVSGPSGVAANIRRHSTLRMGYNLTSNRLVGRSVWNTKWMLVIPARSLGSDKEDILRTFAEKVKDIKIGIRAYSRQGN